MSIRQLILGNRDHDRTCSVILHWSSDVVRTMEIKVVICCDLAQLGGGGLGRLGWSHGCSQGVGGRGRKGCPLGILWSEGLH